MPTSAGTSPAPPVIAALTEDSAEPASEDTAATSDPHTGVPTEADDPTLPEHGPEATPALQEGELSRDVESEAPIGTAAAADAAELVLSDQAIAEPVLDPRASIGALDCTLGTVPVTLDNSRSTGAVRFVVHAVDDYEDWDTGHFLYEELFDVAAGATELVHLPVTGVSFVSILARAFDSTGPELGYAGLRVNCDVAEPKASIGDVACNDFTLPITLDNSRPSTETTFWVEADGESSLREFRGGRWRDTSRASHRDRRLLHGHIRGVQEREWREHLPHRGGRPCRLRSASGDHDGHRWSVRVRDTNNPHHHRQQRGQQYAGVGDSRVDGLFRRRLLFQRGGNLRGRAWHGTARTSGGPSLQPNGKRNRAQRGRTADAYGQLAADFAGHSHRLPTNGCSADGRRQGRESWPRPGSTSPYRCSALHSWGPAACSRFADAAESPRHRAQFRHRKKGRERPGGPRGTRTHNPRIKSPLLCQLS